MAFLLLISFCLTNTHTYIYSQLQDEIKTLRTAIEDICNRYIYPETNNWLCIWLDMK